MQIDATTLADLEVFGGGDGAGGVFDLVDRTQTARGRSALRRRFENPATDPATIRRTQEAVRFFQRHPRVVRLDAPTVESVGRYLRSNITVSRASGLRAHAERAWMAVGYRDLLRELGEGVRGVLDLFDQVARLSVSLREHDVPAAITAVAAPLEETARVVQRARRESHSLLRLDRRLRGELNDRIEEALEQLAVLDALQAMAETTSALGWVLPEPVEAETFHLEAEGLVHPFLEDAVPNPVRLSGGQPMVFLTGPNMAGKTTYLRSVALLALLGQVGMGVPARRMRFTPVEALFTSLNPSDNLRAGLSYFLAEVLRVKEAASLLADGRRALVLFDEVFKGTNVRDALDASAEVILGFARARRSGFVFSSHLAELVERLAANSAIRFCYFDGDIVHGAPEYSYALREGVSEKRFGLLLLRHARVPELIARI